MAFFSAKTLRKTDSSDVATVIGPEAYFHGVVTVRGSLRVEGEVEGNITEAQTVIVGKNGRVQGDICAEFVVVGGSVTGDVVASAQLELKAGGKIVGDLRTPRIMIEDSAVFEGNCTMLDKQAARQTSEQSETIPS